MAILAYFSVAWLVIPLAVYRWTGWHILGWWAIVALVLGVVLDHYLGVAFKH